MKSTSGTSLTEVMVMMVILGISLVGIFTMVNNGQVLASLTDTRLVAINMAREGLESVTTLRDTFALANYSSGTCSDPGSPSAFFTTDGSQILADNCPVIVTSPSPPTPSATPYYILNDTKGLTIGTANDTSVCINEYGWYSQVNSVNTIGPVITCLDEPDACVGNTTQSCKTRFQRKITFANCTPTNPTQCIIATSIVWWGADPDESLSLSQTITVK